MSTARGNQYLTLFDYAKLIDPNGNIPLIAEILNRKTSIIEDAYTMEGNLIHGHETTIRTGLPQAAWRSYNQGTQPSKSTTKKLVCTAGVLEAISAIDEMMVDNLPDGKAFRFSEAAPFLQSLGQTLATTAIYGDVRINPDRFTGLSAYYAQLNAAYQANPDALVNPSTTLPDSGRNVFDASEGGKYGTPGDGYNTSLWLVCWGPNSTHMFFPKGSRAGIYQEDKGKVTMDDGRSVGALITKYVELFRVHSGLVVRDWRQNVRIANIDVRALATASTDQDSAANLVNMATNAVNYLSDANDGKCYWYCNRLVKTALEKMAQNKHNAVLTHGIEDGVMITRLMGIPVHRCDAIMNTEAAVS